MRNRNWKKVVAGLLSAVMVVPGGVMTTSAETTDLGGSSDTAFDQTYYLSNGGFDLVIDENNNQEWELGTIRLPGAVKKKRITGGRSKRWKTENISC